MLLLGSSGGGAASTKTYVDDVFSAYTYTGNGVARTITNGIDLAGKGGLVWTKCRDTAVDHALVDTERGIAQYLASNLTSANASTASEFTAFTSAGYSLDSLVSSRFNAATKTYVSWTFRKAAKFFDVVTFATGSSGNYTFNHSLGTAPGMVIIKSTGNTSNWNVYHRSLGNDSRLFLEQTAAKNDYTGLWLDVTATTFGGNIGTTLESSQTHVAYLFAHNTDTDGIIQCGSFTQSSAVDVAVTLNFEPQYFLVKRTDSIGQWYMLDDMRGFLAGGNTVLSRTLYANLSNAEADLTIQKTANGVTWPAGQYSSGTQTYIYLAIRRPNKPPTLGTQVFAATSFTGVDALQTAGFPVDLVMNVENYDATCQWQWVDRLRGPTKKLECNATSAEGTVSDGKWDSMTQVMVTSSGNNYKRLYPMFKRAPGVFDVVCYTGTGVAKTEAHNLGVAPEMMIVKQRSAGSTNWYVYHSATGNDLYYCLNSSSLVGGPPTNAWNHTSPTASVFTVGNENDINYSASTYVAYLFATKAGISKVGSYTGNGSSQTINCGFTTGARFILIKRTDSAGDWFVWDSVRGIVAGTDPHLSLNTTAAEVTTDDSIDPDTSGFIVNQDGATNINVTSATYIYLAFA